jgi:hypothetical protein
MSIIDNANHSVVPYISGTTKPFTGQRLITITYKTVTDKNSALFNIKRDSKCVSVPMIAAEEITSNLQALIPHIRAMLEDTQKAIVREMIDSRNVSSVNVDDISIASCVEYLESSDNEGGRLTKESVGVWFDSNVADMLAIAIADKLGVSNVPTQQESDKVLATIAAFKGNITALAGGKTSYPAAIASKLKQAIELGAPAGDVIASKFVARLDKMIATPAVNLLDCL